MSIYHEAQKRSPIVVCGVKKNMEKNMGRKSSYFIQTMVGSALMILFYNYIAMRA